MVLVAALCLGVGFGLGGLWQSRHVPQSRDRKGAPSEQVSAKGANETAEPAATPSAVADAPPDPAIVAEVKRQIPNFAAVPLEDGSQILRAAALRDLQAALRQMEPQLKEAEQQVARMEEAQSDTGKQAALKELHRLQAAQAAKLNEFTMRSSAQIAALRQLKESAR